MSEAGGATIRRAHAVQPVTVLGDWSGAGLRIVGAVEARDATVSPAQCALYGAPLGVVPSSVQPTSRAVFFDERLLYPSFQPPGGWGTSPGLLLLRIGRRAGAHV